MANLENFKETPLTTVGVLFFVVSFAASSGLSRGKSYFVQPCKINHST